MTTWTPRLIEPHELDAVVDVTSVGFGVGPVGPPDYRREVRLVTEVDRTFAVSDGDRIVGTCGALSLRVAVPGGSLPLTGVTNAAVLPTHRRRGVLSALLEAVHDQGVARGEPVAGLTASEGGIYRRFGYGVATRFQSVTIDATRFTEVAGVAPGLRPGGGVRLVTEDEAVAVLPAVWDRHWRRVPGEVELTPGMWQVRALDVEHHRAGSSGRFIAVHDDAGGRPDGFLVYRITQGFGSGGTRHELTVESLAAADDAVEAALLRFARDVDLVTTIRWRAPTDLPLRWRLTDPRALEVSAERDLVWLRPLDVAACLGARTYAVESGLVVEVVDAGRAATGGRFRLDGGPDGAACAPTGAEPDVVVRTPDLGALLLGGVTWATLARAGLVDERTKGAVSRADALFRPARAPWCATDF